MADVLKAMLKAARLAGRRPLTTVLSLPGRLVPAKARPAGRAEGKPRAVPKGRPRKPAAARPPRPAPGSFIADVFTCPQGTLDYRFYTPKGSTRRRMPLVVMMHGCSQSARDFAAGTDMNRLADEFGVLVLYPQQSPKANVARCWNWHDPRNQRRGAGEPAVIAALTRHAILLGRADPDRVYVAGISAGGTAAAIIGAAYPDIFAAVGVHSGLSLGHVRSLRSAMSAMRGKAGPPPTGKLPPQLPTIVFHGDGDRVVHPSNAGAFLRNLERSRAGPILSRTRFGRSDGGRDFTRKVFSTLLGEILLEEWTVHGSGHAWSGGRAAGSHTDPLGPEASREMLRFFLSRRRSGRRPANEAKAQRN